MSSAPAGGDTMWQMRLALQTRKMHQNAAALHEGGWMSIQARPPLLTLASRHVPLTLAVNMDKLIFLCEGPRLMPVLCVSVTCFPFLNMLPQSAVTNHADCQCSQEGHMS